LKKIISGKPLTGGRSSKGQQMSGAGEERRLTFWGGQGVQQGAELGRGDKSGSH